MRGDGGVAGEGSVVALPKFHSWGKCTMPLTNINSDWMSNTSSGLCIILGYIIYTGPLSCIFGCNYTSAHQDCYGACWWWEELVEMVYEERWVNSVERVSDERWVNYMRMVSDWLWVYLVQTESKCHLL